MSETIQANAATAEIIRNNWKQVQGDVVSACTTAGRDPSEVTIVGVSKYVDPPFALQLAEAGCLTLGENRPQHLWAAAEHCRSLSGLAIEWHMIGHLQRNKAQKTLPQIACLHSLDSLRLAETISQLAVLSVSLKTLVEVNVSQEQSKTGIPLDEVEPFLASVIDLPGLQVVGLMAMTTLGASADQARREFEVARQIRDALQERFGESVRLSELSMGMSGDFAEAISEGSTMVRIGTRLWQGILKQAG